jgi:hypothetical protein
MPNNIATKGLALPMVALLATGSVSAFTNDVAEAANGSRAVWCQTNTGKAATVRARYFTGTPPGSYDTLNYVEIRSDSGTVTSMWAQHWQSQYSFPFSAWDVGVNIPANGTYYNTEQWTGDQTGFDFGDYYVNGGYYFSQWRFHVRFSDGSACTAGWLNADGFYGNYK